ncbi:Arc family DNA-binding protein [Rhizobium tropici]|uniref:Arc family DNA-binding protein n=1 Tax=Rhizobium tropici TaxID=398 RepID=A0A5B0W558_RHITR|nr:Arc family DNA-binding protein [Rhizobium tropici]KAA1182110.1 Arc family DNA-binding protein [Rhizobium tropici]
MAREDPQLKLRLTEELKALVTNAAKANGRSVNAEIVSRLESSFSNEDEIAYLRDKDRENETIINRLTGMVQDLTAAAKKEREDEKENEEVRQYMREVEERISNLEKALSRVSQT